MLTVTPPLPDVVLNPSKYHSDVRGDSRDGVEILDRNVNRGCHIAMTRWYGQNWFSTSHAQVKGEQTLNKRLLDQLQTVIKSGLRFQ